jgi:SET domain-containing protein
VFAGGTTAVLQHSDAIYVKRVKGKGRGVFARRAIAAGAVIEKVPKLLVPIESISNGFANPHLARYFFLHDHRTVAVCLGYGSLYNHSYRPNAKYEEGPAATMIFRALRRIKPHEEICINYNGDPQDKAPMMFEVKE